MAMVLALGFIGVVVAKVATRMWGLKKLMKVEGGFFSCGLGQLAVVSS